MIMLYLKLILVAIAGQSIQILMKSESLSKTAKISNVQYNIKWFLTLDWKPIAKAAVGIVTFFLVFGDIANPKHLANQNALYTLPFNFQIPMYLLWNVFWLLVSFVFGGFGSYIAFKFQSEATIRILGAVDSKTTNADKASGNLDSPTPATKL